MIYGFDWGAYVGPTYDINIPYKMLLDNGVGDFFVCKGAMKDDNEHTDSLKNFDAARSAGIPVVGGYYYNYPTQSAQYQIDTYCKAIERENPDFIAIDIEEHPLGKTSLSLSENAKYVCYGIYQTFPNKKIVIYTSWNQVQAYSPDMNSWINNYDVWIASWPDYGTKRTYQERLLTFDQIKSYPLPGWSPLMPYAWKNRKFTFWQFGTWQIPINTVNTLFEHQYDWNIFNGNLEELKLWAGVKSGPTLPTLENRVADLERRVQLLEDKTNV